MKNVVPTSQVFHLWANRFQGDTIFSYGQHFPLARHVKRRSAAVLHNCDTYGPTTGSHQQAARQATSNIALQFKVASLGDFGTGSVNHSQNLSDYRARIIKASKTAIAARRVDNKERALREAQALVDEANRYRAYFGIRCAPLEQPPDLAGLKANIEQLEAAEARSEKREIRAQATRNAEWLRRQQQRDAERQAELEKDVPAWLAGEPVGLYGYSAILLRLKDSETVETSAGASFSLEDAKRLLPVIRGGQAYQHNGHSLRAGQFRIDSIDEAGNLVAGCHKINRQEIERFASTLGL